MSLSAQSAQSWLAEPSVETGVEQVSLGPWRAHDCTSRLSQGVLCCAKEFDPLRYVHIGATHLLIAALVVGALAELVARTLAHCLRLRLSNVVASLFFNGERRQFLSVDVEHVALLRLYNFFHRRFHALESVTGVHGCSLCVVLRREGGLLVCASFLLT